MNIHESAEDYLEKILMLQEKKGSVRSIDIAVAMGFSKPSVSVAMKNLRENGYISMDPDGFIKLEAPGMEHDLSEETYRKMIDFAEKATQNQ